MPAQCVSNSTKPGDVKYTILYNKEKNSKDSISSYRTFGKTSHRANMRTNLETLRNIERFDLFFKEGWKICWIYLLQHNT